MPAVKILKKPTPKPTPQPVQEPEKVEMHQPTATVTTDYPDGTSTQSSEEIGGPIKLVGPQANVGVSMGMTMQTEPFNNIKFSVSLFIPCSADVDEINDTYAQIKGWVDERMGEITDEIQSQLTGEEAVAE